MSGLRFGRALVLRFDKISNGHAWWIIRCDCGNEKSVDGSSLRRGSTKSCGCMGMEMLSLGPKIAKKHGHTIFRSRTYQAWNSMKQRCYNPRNDRYYDYGGRGIKVCDRWRNSFEAFLQDMGERPHGKSIDRKDFNGDYNPENCRWATAKEQQNNMRSNVRIEWLGEIRTISQWAECNGIKRGTLSTRIRRGWSIADALLPVT